MIGADPEDLAVFYDLDAFGDACARRRPGVDDVPFVGNRGAVDETVLGGYAVAAEHSLDYLTDAVDLDEGDLVLVGIEYERDAAGHAVKVDGRPVFVLVGGVAQGGVPFRVRTEPRRFNDGRETEAILSGIPT